jgi:hypothetical protein
MSCFLPSVFRNTGLALAAAVLLAGPAHAVQFDLSGVAGDVYSYTLTYDPLDNYAIPGTEDRATILLTGLSGVVSATGPTSTSFPNAYIDGLNLAWTAEVLAGGTEVLFTHIGPGTGNFDSPMYVYGFSITAPGQTSGTVSFETSGFRTDVTYGLTDRDVTGTTIGPTAVPEPSSLALVLGGLAISAGAAKLRRRS